MTRFRWQLLAGILLVSVALAFVLRDIAYQLIIVPLAYVFWLAGVYYSAVPQLLIWGLLILFLFVGVTWKLIPEVAASPRRQVQRPPAEGQVELLAIWLFRGRSSNYFKWQVANRLARLARRFSEGPGPAVDPHASRISTAVSCRRAESIVRGLPRAAEFDSDVGRRRRWTWIQVKRSSIWSLEWS